MQKVSTMISSIQIAPILVVALCLWIVALSYLLTLNEGQDFKEQLISAQAKIIQLQNEQLAEYKEAAAFADAEAIEVGE